jgi:hypothetical protein
MKITERQIRRLIREALSSSRLHEATKPRATDWESYIDITSKYDGISKPKIQTMVGQYIGLLQNLKKAVSKPEEYDKVAIQAMMDTMSLVENQDPNKYYDFVKWYMRFNDSDEAKEIKQGDKYLSTEDLMILFNEWNDTFAKTLQPTKENFDEILKDIDKESATRNNKTFIHKVREKIRARKAKRRNKPDRVAKKADKAQAKSDKEFMERDFDK